MDTRDFGVVSLTEAWRVALAFSGVGSAFLLAAGWVATRSSMSPPQLLFGLAAVAAAFAGYFAVARQRSSRGAVLLLVVASLAAMLMLSLTTTTAVGLISNGNALFVGCLLAAWVLPLSRLRIVAWPTQLGYLTIVLLRDLPEARFAGITLTVMAVVVLEVFARMRRALVEVASTDPLTGALNRRGLAGALQPAGRWAGRDRRFVVAVADLDELKQVNEERGYEAGDRMIRDVVASWRATLRPGDLLARYGGDEFVLVVFGRDEDEVRHRLEQSRATSEVGWSFGIAAAGPGRANPADFDGIRLLATERMRADKAARRTRHQ